MTVLSPLRDGRITGSRVAAVIGVDPYRDADDVLREMVRATLGAEEEFITNPAVEYGVEHEPDAIAWYELDTGRFVYATGDYQEFVPHPELDLLGVTPDGLIDDDGTVEVKCPLWANYTSIRQRPDYEAQCQLVLACTGREWLDFVIWRPSGALSEPVTPDPWWLEQNLPTLTKFHERYLDVVTNPDLAAPYLQPLVDERTDPEWMLSAWQFLDAQAALDTAKAEFDDSRQRLVDLADGRKTRGAGVLVYTSKGSTTVRRAGRG